MWMYEKRLQYPVNIKNPDPKMAQFIMSQYGGPDGEIGASMRYLSQRYAMPYDTCKAVLTDIGTEELAHMEIVAAIIHQLTRNLTPEQIVEAGFGPYYIDHTTGIWPQAAGGVPFNACEFQSKGDVITDLVEDMAAEQKARTTYDNILRVVKDPDVCDPIRYLREREIVHFQRFGEALRITQDHLDSRNFYAFNPAFDQVRGSQPENGTEHQPQVPPSVITPPENGSQAGEETVLQPGGASGGGQMESGENGAQSGAAQSGSGTQTGNGMQFGNGTVSGGASARAQTGNVMQPTVRTVPAAQRQTAGMAAGTPRSAAGMTGGGGQMQQQTARSRQTVPLSGRSGNGSGSCACPNMPCGSPYTPFGGC